MWITFTERHKVQQGDGNGPLYEPGKSYEFKGFVAETYARKYISRGLAVEGKPEPKVEPKPVEVKPVEAKAEPKIEKARPIFRAKAEAKPEPTA